MINIHTLTDEEFRALPLIREGESKIIRDAGENMAVIKLKPTIYSYTHNRAGEIPGSDLLRLKACKIFNTLLQDNGVDTAYIEVGDRYILSRQIADQPPIEVIVKAFHMGTPKHRYYGMSGFSIRGNHPNYPGFSFDDDGRYPEPFVRFDWRNPNFHPETKERLADEVLCESQADWFINTIEARKTALKAFTLLSDFLLERKIILCDICFFISSDGKTSFGEISQDCARFRHVEMSSLDKDVWRAGGSSEHILEKWKTLVDLVSSE